MASEVQVQFVTSKTLYALIRNATGSVWRTDNTVFEAYNSANFSHYTISLTEQGTSGFYAGTFPSAITAGVFGVVVKQQIGGSPAESDPTIASGDFQWDGANPLPLSNLATSGQVGQLAPLKLAYGVMIQNFPIYLKSATDHITPFTSGVVSGQIARDGGNFGALQSGAFVEGGAGFYLTTLTSGDLAGQTIRLLFTGTGISGGTSDPLPMSFVAQHTSGR
jgi:hypothetical protein